MSYGKRYFCSKCTYSQKLVKRGKSSFVWLGVLNSLLIHQKHHGNISIPAEPSFCLSWLSDSSAHSIYLGHIVGRHFFGSGTSSIASFQTTDVVYIFVHFPNCFGKQIDFSNACWAQTYANRSSQYTTVRSLLIKEKKVVLECWAEIFQKIVNYSSHGNNDHKIIYTQKIIINIIWQQQ